MDDKSNPYRRAWAEVDLGALEQNVRAIRERLPVRTAIAGVVKADGYGHGAVPVAKTIAPQVNFFCVASAEEALSLRRHGIRKPVLILGPVPEESFEELIREEVRLTICAREEADALSRAALRSKRQALLHLAVDTGMNRIGVSPSEEGVRLAEYVAGLPGLRTEGVFTHFSRADERDPGPARRQLEAFEDFLRRLRERRLEPELRHAANSAGAMELLGCGLDMVRAGIILYGIYPSGELRREAIALRPVLALKSRVSCVRRLRAGAEVGYGGIFRAERDMTAAVVSIGYADGYPRALSNRGELLIAGRRARILGRICMDQLVADVSDIPEAARGSVVTLLGRDGAEEISVEELSALSGRFPYEFVCGIGRRVPRVYLRGGEIAGFKDWFQDQYEDFC